ncbi:MAG: DUF3794 domain-containing protein [Clostridia bacterium]|nr:DUF3794 domain-containing protein [Clostridia bacterium]
MELEKKNIFLPEITPGTVYRKDLELDGALSEDQPDISRLIRIDAHASEPEVENENGKLCVKSRVVFGILYESDLRGRPAYAQTEADFTQSTDIVSPAGEYYALADIRCTYLTCKLLGARRYVIRAAMETSVSVVSVKEQPAIDIPASGEDGVFLRTEERVYSLPCRLFTEERRETGSAVSPAGVEAVLFTDYHVSSPEWESGEGRLTVRVPVFLKAFCETEDGSFITVPFSAVSVLTAEDPDITPESTFSVDACVPSCVSSAESDEYGEMRVIKFDYSVRVNAVCFEKTRETVATDAFSAAAVCETESKRVAYRDRADEIKKEFRVQKEFDTEKTDIRGVSDITVSFSVNSAECAEGRLVVKGVFTADYLTDTDSGMTGGSFGGEFEESAVCEDGCGVMRVRVFPLEAVYDVKGGGVLSLEVSACLCAELYRAEETSALVSANVSEPLPKPPCGIRFYYPEEGETAWSIAKCCRVDPEKLVAENPGAFTPEGGLAPGAAFVAVK